MLKTEKNYEFRKEMLQVHEKDIRNKALLPSTTEFEIKNGFVINIPQDDEVILTAAKDFADFLFISMGVSAQLRFGKAEGGGNEMELCLCDDKDKMGIAAGYRGCLIDVADEKLTVHGFDSRGVAQGLYFLEDLMTFKKAPYLEKKIIRKKPMYGPQMVHSGYGLDEYPDEYLAAVAHEGRDAILVFVKDVHITPYGYLDFNELIYRASKYGIDVYAYSYLKSGVHPEDPGAEEYYEASYGRLFRECPGLKGVTLVGESVAFPSHDPHTEWGPKGGQPVRSDIPSKEEKIHPGWWPCCDYPQWLNMLKKVIRKYNKDADIVFWTYNWGSRPEEERIKLIESLPTDISLQATFEMFEAFEKDGLIRTCDDYSLSFEGPGKYFTNEAIAAKKRGIRMYSMTNTGGLTWDLGVIPYEPFPYQWIKRYKAMEKAHKEWGLCGLMESHHYGFYPSFISKLSKWAFCEEHEDMESILLRILKSEYGDENGDTVNRALKLWSEAIEFYPATDNNQYGAFRVGPSHPFCLDITFKIPDASYSMFGNRIHNPVYGEYIGPEREFLNMRVPKERAALEKMKNLIEEGLALMEKIADKNDKLLKLINMGWFIYRAIITGINATSWYLLKKKLYYVKDKDVIMQTLDEMEELLTEEKENAEKTIPIVRVDSRLGWEPSMEYMTDEEHLNWKIKQVEYVIEVEIARFRKAVREEQVAVLRKASTAEQR
ncbi:MAG: hypothetical protein IJN99_02400 [Clostridia bacterium]|nr:hypothetical protein [Clostridia bacterium]